MVTKKRIKSDEKIKTSLHISKQLWADLKIVAAASGVTRNQLVTRALAKVVLLDSMKTEAAADVDLEELITGAIMRVLRRYQGISRDSVTVKRKSGTRKAKTKKRGLHE